MSKHRNGFFFLKLTKPRYSFTLEQKFGIGKILKIILFPSSNVIHEYNERGERMFNSMCLSRGA